jgi:GNAT superfamily N-acetyltransferase
MGGYLFEGGRHPGRKRRLTRMSHLAYDRVRRGWRRHGIGGLARRVPVKAWHRLAHNATLVFMRRGGGSSAPLPAGLAIIRCTAKEQVPSRALVQLTAEEGVAVQHQMRKEFGRGAELWIACCDDQVAAYQWTVRGRFLEHWHVAVAPNDVVVFSTVTLPRFRSRGMATLVADHAITTLLGPDDFAFIDTKEWNRDALRFITRAGFTPVRSSPESPVTPGPEARPRLH